MVPMLLADIFSMASQPAAPTAPTQTQTQTQQASTAQAAAQAQAIALSKRRGASSTELTSPLGAGPGQTTRATLGA